MSKFQEWCNFDRIPTLNKGKSATTRSQLLNDLRVLEMSLNLTQGQHDDCDMLKPHSPIWKKCFRLA